MYLTRTAVLFTIPLFSSLALAQDYRVEVAAGYVYTDEIEFADELNRWTTGATYYFSPVQTKNHPLAEAAFLERASSVSVNYGRQETDSSGSFWGEAYRNSVTDQNVGFAVNYFIPDSIFYVAAGAARNKSDSLMRWDNSDESRLDEERTAWFGSLGITPTDGLLVWATFSDDEELDDSWSINTKYVTELWGQTVNLEASRATDDGDSTFSFGGDVYLNRTFSLGASYVIGDGSDAYLVRTRKFFTDRLSLEAVFMDQDLMKQYGLGVSFRF